MQLQSESIEPSSLGFMQPQPEVLASTVLVPREVLARQAQSISS
jgi:hypothetical protein